MKKILLLGSGELGKEFVISTKRLGCHVVACDSYAGAPAMQVADAHEVFSMLDEAALRAAIAKHQPDLIVPEIEAIRTEVLLDVEKEGFEVIPSARAANLDYEITLLTVRQRQGATLFCPPIGHVQERGDYQYSWQPQAMKPEFLKAAQDMADKVTADLGGAGIFGVEFFVTKDEVIFSELSPRPHDTGMVTLISQNLSEFDLHARAVLGLPIPVIEAVEGASAVVLADSNGTQPTFSGVEDALREPGVDVRIFGKPTTRPYRRMAVALAKGPDALARARAAAAKIKVHVQPA